MTGGGAACAAVLAVLGCERERRTFAEPGPGARPAGAGISSSLVAGGPPIEGAALELALPGYAETAQAVSEGKQLYGWFNCVGCHAHGGGAIGPPLMDDVWIYGSAPAEVALSIVAGRPRGMPSFHGKIAPAQLVQIVAYVRSLGGLVRGDAVSARDEHLQTAPAATLQHHALPRPGRERP